MEQETSEYKIRPVSKVQLRVLAVAGGFENKGECLTRTMDDGRLEIVMLRTEFKRFKQLYSEVDAESRELDEPAPIELPETDISPLPLAPKDNIPDIDKQIWKQAHPDVVPVIGENNRPRDGGTSLGNGRIDIGGIFNR